MKVDEEGKKVKGEGVKSVREETGNDAREGVAMCCATPHSDTRGCATLGVMLKVCVLLILGRLWL